MRVFTQHSHVPFPDELFRSCLNAFNQPYISNQNVRDGANGLGCISPLQRCLFSHAVHQVMFIKLPQVMKEDQIGLHELMRPGFRSV